MARQLKQTLVWIPIDTRLPEFDEIVLVFVPDDWEEIYFAFNSRDAGWVKHGDSPLDEFSPTHWMPLPKPPDPELD